MKNVWPFIDFDCYTREAHDVTVRHKSTTPHQLYDSNNFPLTVYSAVPISAVLCAGGVVQCMSDTNDGRLIHFPGLADAWTSRTPFGQSHQPSTRAQSQAEGREGTSPILPN